MTTTLQPLIDATAWDLLNRRTPYLARAIYEYLQAGRTPIDVLEDVRLSCTDGTLLPLLACAIHGCASGFTAASSSDQASSPIDRSTTRSQWPPSRHSTSRCSDTTDVPGYADAAVVLPSLPQGLATEGLEEIRGAIARSRTRGRRRRFLVH